MTLIQTIALNLLAAGITAAGCWHFDAVLDPTGAYRRIDVSAHLFTGCSATVQAMSAQ